MTTLFLLFGALVVIPECSNSNIDELNVTKNTVVLQNIYRIGAELKISLLNVDQIRPVNVITNLPDTEFTTDSNDHLLFDEFKFEDFPNITQYSLTYILKTINASKELCFHYGHQGTLWYSTYEEKTQSWPMDINQSLPTTGFVTDDFYQGPIGSMVEYLFWTSNGFAIYVDYRAPLFIRRSDNGGDPLLCFSLNIAPPYTNQAHTVGVQPENELHIHIAAANDVKAAHRFPYNRYFLKPKAIPDERMLTYPVWSTWARFGRDIDQDKVINFGREIREHGYPNAQLEIDDKWETHYGDFTFDVQRFPDPKKMIDELKAMGYRVTLWVFPFVNSDSDVFLNNTQYFVKNTTNETTLVKWWNGQGAAIDFIEKETSDWFVNRLKKLQNETGIDSYKCDAGEINFLGQNFRFQHWIPDFYPNKYTDYYVATCARLGTNVEVRSAFNSQDKSIFLRMMDRESHWGTDNGLKSLIPAALTFSLAGYSFILPDMIGGNGEPTEELYIRWLQANTFMPALQFSVTPWEFSERAVNITHKFIDLHIEYAPKIIEFLKHRVNSNEPLLRPMWWLDPEDPETYAIDDQFMLGDDILVAPVVEQGQTSRHVYLPKGAWIEQNDNKTYTGPTHLTVSAPIEVLPYFIRHV